MKKFLALALSASMTLALAGCGGGNNSDQAANNDTASNGETTTITLWTYPIGSWGGTDSKLDDIIASFNQAHPEITVKYETLDYQNGDNQVTSAITSNNTPDIIMEGPERLVSNWGAAGKMVDLSDLWTDTKDDIAAVSESVVSACQLDGKYYEYPLCMTTHCMAINYELFEKANALQYIDEETRTWTTDNFVKAMEAVRDSGLAPVPGIIYCGGTGGDQGTRALVNNLYSGQYTNAEHTAYTV
ncbi:MAG: ABC transporter substrate-binding protein, partial [Butyricicoccus sp.]